MKNKMTTEEIKKWQVEHLTPEIKSEAEEVAEEYDTDNHIDTSHTFCDDCGHVIPDNEETWSYQDDDGNRYCRYCKHKHMSTDED